MADHFLPVAEMGMVLAGMREPVADDECLSLGGGLARFRQVRRVGRNADGGARVDPPEPARHIRDPDWNAIRGRIVSRRSPFCGVSLRAPALVGIVNVTPDSFSDGGLYADASAAARHGRRLVEEGADIVDFGGESTRPGALEVSAKEEIRRVLPAIEQFRQSCPNVPVSIDTRKAVVARRALAAGAGIVNDVSGLSWDTRMVDTALEFGAFVCVMHAQGTPAEMQRAPDYRSALLDIYEWLERRLEHLVRRGIPRERIAVDPGIGFGKTHGHNMELLSGLALFHGLGCPLLVGASRKSFIRAFPSGEQPDSRLPGSLAAALRAASAGTHLLRVHDVAETAQALALWYFPNGSGDR